MICRSLVLFLLSVSMTECGRVLISAPFSSKSHQNTYIPVIKSLAGRGHHITLITNYLVGDLKAFINVQQIEIAELQLGNDMFAGAFKKAMGSGGSMYDQVSLAVNTLMKLDNMSVNVASIMYANPQVQQLLKSDTFDLVMVSQFFGISGYPFAWHFNASLALFSPGSLFPGVASALGDSDHYEFIPNPTLELSNRMSLPQRVVNTLSMFTMGQMFTRRHRSAVRSIAQTVLPDCPPLDDIEEDISLVFTNSHPIFHYTRPLTPEMIEIGGVHCKPARPLPSMFKEFVGDHEEGFIIFAIGSALQMSDMPIELLNAFIEVFRQLPQRVIWQWKGEKTAVNLPDNVMTADWLPQQDLLGHKGCRLFLTHGGLNSVMEAVYHGVPILGLPLSTDQFANLVRSQQEGYSMTLNWKDVKKQTLSTNIHELLNNPKYSEAAARLSDLMRDQPQTPVERAVFWTEFNLRHKGAKHLRLGSRYLAPYQRALIDVYAVILATVLVPIALLVLVVRKCCCAKKTKQGNKKEKKQ